MEQLVALVIAPLNALELVTDANVYHIATKSVSAHTGNCTRERVELPLALARPLIPSLTSRALSTRLVDRAAASSKKIIPCAAAVVKLFLIAMQNVSTHIGRFIRRPAKTPRLAFSIRT